MTQITALQALQPASHIRVLDNHGVTEPEKTYHAIQTVGQPASLKVTLQMVDVFESGVCVSKSCMSNSFEMFAFSSAAILPISQNLVIL